MAMLNYQRVYWTCKKYQNSLRSYEKPRRLNQQKVKLNHQKQGFIYEIFDELQLFPVTEK